LTRAKWFHTTQSGFYLQFPAQRFDVVQESFRLGFH
jgi:hypothetical protein